MTAAENDHKHRCITDQVAETSEDTTCSDSPDAAALAEKEYRTNSNLTAFHAFGENDLYVEDETAPKRGEVWDVDLILPWG